MNDIQKQAQELAKKFEWDADKAFEFAYALLTECNLHTEAAAMKETFDRMMAEIDDEPGYEEEFPVYIGWDGKEHAEF